jgi:hypothetical protein
MTFALVALLVALAGPTLYVTNDSYQRVVIGDSSGRLATLMAGESKCVEFFNPYITQRLWWKYTAEQKRYTVSIYPAEFEGWEWTLTSSFINTSINLRPALRPCVK